MPAEIRFYRAIGLNGFLSNLWRCPVPFESRMFDSAEHAYQFGKPRRRVVSEHLVLADTPALVAFYAHALPPWEIRPDWSAVKIDRMRAVLAAKFSQNRDLLRRLLETGEAQLLETSKTDAFWGMGARGRGRNMLGRLLMDLRAQPL